MPAVLNLPGFASTGLFTLHEAQSLPIPSPFAMTAIYSLSDRIEALNAWSAQHATRSGADLASMVESAEVTCWQPRTPRLLAQDVLDPTPHAAAEEQRARAAYHDRYLTQADLARLLNAD